MVVLLNRQLPHPQQGLGQPHIRIRARRKHEPPLVEVNRVAPPHGLQRQHGGLTAAHDSPEEIGHGGLGEGALDGEVVVHAAILVGGWRLAVGGSTIRLPRESRRSATFVCAFPARHHVHLMASYRDLEVWQKSRKLATHIYRKTAKFPRNEWYGLVQQ